MMKAGPLFSFQKALNFNLFALIRVTYDKNNAQNRIENKGRINKLYCPMFRA